LSYDTWIQQLMGHMAKAHNDLRCASTD